MLVKVRKAVFPAAGLGTRFLPATKAQPKEILPVVDKPIIQYGVEEAVASGIQNMIIVTGQDRTAIENHFGVSVDLENLLASRKKVDLLDLVRKISRMANISYVRQENPSGLGHAVLCARQMVGEEPFAVVLSDDVIRADKPCLRQLLDVHESFDAPVLAIMEVPKESLPSYGVVDAEPVSYNGTKDRLFRIRDLVEKPAIEDAPSNLAIIGRYVLTPDIFECLSNVKPGAVGEIQLTDGIRGLLETRPIYGYRFEGKRYDAGNKLGFLQATVEFALDREDLGAPFREYLKGLKL